MIISIFILDEAKNINICALKTSIVEYIFFLSLLQIEEQYIYLFKNIEESG